MATTATIDRKSSVFSLATLAAPFIAVGRFLVMIAEASPKVQELERLSRISDRTLAARGLTRDGEMRRIMGVSMTV